MLENNSEIEVKRKMIILQVLGSFEIPLTNDQITEFILENELLNYFDLQQYLNELTESKMIDKDVKENDEVFYFLTDNGRDSLSFFNTRLSKNLRQLINDKVSNKKDRIISDTNISADYERLENNEYLVKLKVEEYNHTLMNLELNIISNEHAKKICEKWENEAQFLYGDILNLLVNDKK